MMQWQNIFQRNPSLGDPLPHIIVPTGAHVGHVSSSAIDVACCICGYTKGCCCHNPIMRFWCIHNRLTF
uniref:Uncharacterized protein n=1 Tax=Gossypium raimondii TaxID=29730 RepID=A0A0D2QUF5_GOSRA|nr:hypothetical protein B456_004G087100 [Gossypium raimondii]